MGQLKRQAVPGYGGGQASGSPEGSVGVLATAADVLRTLRKASLQINVLALRTRRPIAIVGRTMHELPFHR